MQEVIQKIILMSRIAGTFEAAQMVSEIWVASDSSGKMPSEAPDRREGVMFANYVEGAKELKMWSIKREGEKARRGELEPFEKFGGWIEKGLVPLPPVISDSVREGAKSWLSRIHTLAPRP